MRAWLLVGVASLALAGCGGEGVGVSVDLKTDWQPGRQFVGVLTTVGVGLGHDFQPVGSPEQTVSTTQDFLGGHRVAEFEGLAPGNYVIRVELLTPEGATLALRDTLLHLTEGYALTVLLTSSCDEVVCPGEGSPTENTACYGGRCVDPRCSPETPEFCGEPTCATDADCGAVGCAAGVCVESECLLRAEDRLCGDGYVCDLIGGCTLDVGVDGGAGCAPTETSCDDAEDDDCDGDVDCADSDCASQSCDDGSVCTAGDVCTGGICTGSAMDCDDGNGCTDDSCDAIDGCQSTPNTAACDDGTWCNGSDTCRDGACQDHADPPCTEFCNESAMNCDMCLGDGDCGSVSFGGWSACGGFSGTCGEAGTQTRSVMTPRCNAGSCTVDVTTEAQSCSRDQDGVSCGTTTFGSWGNCGGFDDACDTDGTQSRTQTTRTCGGGSCRSDTNDQTRACSRSVANGKSCGSGRVCCGNSCVSLSSNTHCGACRVDCAAVGLSCGSTGTGGFSCRGCSSNSQCTNVLNGAATCYQLGSPPTFCQCQCAGNGVCTGGGCGANFFCHDEPGHNYCSPNR